MLSLRRGLAALGVALAFVLLAPAVAAFADDDGQAIEDCLNKPDNPDGTPVECDPSVLDSDSDFSSDFDEGLPVGAFVGAFVVIALLGAATTVWKVSTARRLATESGMDPGLATQVTLLTDDGLEATYLSANLRGKKVADSDSVDDGPAPIPATAAQRLAELKTLLDDGVITQAEHDARRQAIIDAI